MMLNCSLYQRMDPIFSVYLMRDGAPLYMVVGFNLFVIRSSWNLSHTTGVNTYFLCRQVSEM